MSTSLKYANETDKAYGLVGMAIALFAWDAEDLLESIDLDAAPEEAMHMSADYYLCFAPRVRAKSVWEQSLKRFQLATAMTVANVVCRNALQNREPRLTDTTISELDNFLYEEGKLLCSLEHDEVSEIYSRSLNYCQRLFSHAGVCDLTRQVAKHLMQQRTLASNEIMMLLAPLSRI